METNSTKKLINIAENKGFIFERGDKTLFKKYSYYQVVNAYKNLFVADEETIEEIKDNIFSNKKIDFYRKFFKVKNDVQEKELYETICNRISKKYGLNGSTLEEKERQIKTIKYHHHIYSPRTLYTDFVRMYKFEHELRMMLLKYTLIVEENIKNIFTSYLNDIGAKPNYLINMDNYDTNSLKSKSFDTVKLMIDKYDNQKSKPIKRKRDQHLPVPYWIIINELAMNQTYYAIANLKQDKSYAIFLRCLNFFTELNFNEEKRGKTQKQVQYEKKMVNNFKTLLCYLGEFRNMLAHNQPIYSYNVQEYSIKSNSKFKYELPSTKTNYIDKNGNNPTKEQQQINIMGSLMNCLQDYFGKDNINSNNSTKLDLSKIIYILYKMLKHIDSNTKFYTELTKIYAEYNIILSKNNIKVKNTESIIELKKDIQILSEYNLEKSIIIENISTNKPYKRLLNEKERELMSQIRTIKKLSKNIDIEIEKSKYKHFPAQKRYSEFTGIDLNFFNNIE